MPSFQMNARAADGVDFNGVHYAKGSVLATSTNALLLQALSEVAEACDVFRTTSPGGQVTAEIAREEVMLESLPVDSSALGVKKVQEHANVPTADPDAIKVSIATSTSIEVYDGADLNGVVGGSPMVPARNVTITQANHANHSGGNAIVVGEDVNGDPQTDTLALTDDGNAVATGTKCFRKVTSVTLPAQAGTAGAFQIGFGALIGLAHKPKVRGGAGINVRELVDGVPPTAGTFVLPATSGPNGTYAPNQAPNGARDYFLEYETEEAAE